MDDLSRRYTKAVVIVKTSPHAARTAAVGAKHYANQRWSTSPKRSKARRLVIPAVVASGVVVMRQVRSSKNGSEGDIDRPLGPVASADTVSPPADAAAAAAQSEAAQSETAGSDSAQSEAAAS